MIPSESLAVPDAVDAAPPAPRPRRAARKAAAEKAPAAKTRAKPAAKARPTSAEAKAKPAAAKSAKPAKAVKAPKPPKADKSAKPAKAKLVRDSFSIPKDEYEALGQLKARALGLEAPVRKSELLRAGIRALAAMSDRAFLGAVKAVPTLKTGRPKTAAQ